MNSAIGNLCDTLHRMLLENPAGLSEIELIRLLEKQEIGIFNADLLKDNLHLFQAHFLLFHHLYRLRDNLASSGDSIVDISPLKIRLQHNSHSQQKMIDQHDPLRDYYLDITNFSKTTADDVTELIEQFWTTLQRNDRRAEALAQLNLKDPVSWETIKNQHRRLVMKHHPDRGGDGQKLQVINAALDILKINK